MANAVEIKVRLKITLATEDFKGKYHTGQSQTAYMLNHPVTIFTQGDSDSLKWMQDRDKAGNHEDRLPGNGIVSVDQADCTLYDRDRKPVVTLSNFTAPASSSSGSASYEYKTSKYTQQQDSNLQWVGRGVWEMVEDRSPGPAPRYLTSAWTFNTSASASVSGLVVEFGSGTITLNDPGKVSRRFAYIGGGGAASLDLGKMLKLIKALKNLVWMEKVAEGASQVGKAGGGSSTEDNFSNGVILKNVLTVGGRELTKDDFIGQCMWIDASAGIYRSVGGMLLLTNVSSTMGVITFRACIPCVGTGYTPIGAGVGACVGWISPA